MHYSIQKLTNIEQDTVIWPFLRPPIFRTEPPPPHLLIWSCVLPFKWHLNSIAVRKSMIADMEYDMATWWIRWCRSAVMLGVA